MALPELVFALGEGAKKLSRKDSSCFDGLPSRQEMIEIVRDLRALLFPGFHGNADIRDETLSFHLGYLLDSVQKRLRDQVKRGFCFECCGGDYCSDCDERAREKTADFLSRLPGIQENLFLDARAHYEGDPAASTPEETIFCYPGILAITNYRLAHELFELSVPLLPRMITEHAHSITGIDIHPGAKIGSSFFIDHGTGVVIGETSEIGDRVKIYQGVTLGAKSFALDEQGNPIKGVLRHPIVEDDVIVYSGATILGRVRIGRGSVIGGNVWLVRDVPPGSRITQARPEKEVFTDGEGI
ncbi:MAG: serine acetyltransferase [Deltaproteobacteria bacterium]|nr:serine acetyltransferase [Deltaproteobacteria bacterium]